MKKTIKQRLAGLAVGAMAVGAIVGGGQAVAVVTAESASAYTVTATRYHWNGSGCYLMHYRNYSGWEEWTGQGSDGWYPQYRIGDWNCGRYTS